MSYYSPDRDEYLYAKDRGARCAVDNHVPGHRLVFRLRYNYLGVIMVVPSALQELLKSVALEPHETESKQLSGLRCKHCSMLDKRVLGNEGALPVKL